MTRCLVAREDEKMKISTFGCLRFEMVIYSNCFSFPSSFSQESLLGDGDAPKTNVEGSD